MVLRRFAGFYRSRLLPYYRTLDLVETPGSIEQSEDLHDLHHAEQINRIWKESSGRYGVRKVWQKLKREGYVIARCTVARIDAKTRYTRCLAW